jgi:hypothetical protein
MHVLCLSGVVDEALLCGRPRCCSVVVVDGELKGSPLRSPPASAGCLFAGLVTDAYVNVKQQQQQQWQWAGVKRVSSGWEWARQHAMGALRVRYDPRGSPAMSTRRPHAHGCVPQAPQDRAPGLPACSIFFDLTTNNGQKCISTALDKQVYGEYCAIGHRPLTANLPCNSRPAWG